MAIPARYRDQIRVCCDASLVLTVDKDRCLLLYPQPEWLEIERKLKALPSLNKTARALQRLYIGHAQDVEMDGQGRILLSPELRQFAGLERKVCLVGQGDKFEIWSESSWQQTQDELLSGELLDDFELSPELSSLSI
jgi:MraZ protein